MLTINTACGTVASPWALTDAARRRDKECDRSAGFNKGCVSVVGATKEGPGSVDSSSSAVSSSSSRSSPA